MNGQNAQPSQLQQPQQPRRKQDFFVYSTGRLATLAAGLTSTNFINIQSDADFIIEKQTYAADVAGAVLTFNTFPVPNITALVSVTGSGQNILSQAVPIASIFGHGFLPFILPRPRFLPANSQLQIVLTSFEAVTSYFITLNFIGRKIYLLGTGV
jgi:hypothetical protein